LELYATSCLFFDVALLDRINRFLVMLVGWAAAAVVTICCVQASLFHMPLCYFDMLIYVHCIAPCNSLVFDNIDAEYDTVGKTKSKPF
jgi:hypothetical protein